MSVGRFKYLFSPLKLGRLTLKNRVVFSAHLTNYAERGLASERHAAYYAARAAGGAGLIITEEHSTHPTDWPYEKLIHGYRPEAVPGYRRITAAVHRHGTPILAQINHNGGQASGLYTRRPVWAPSATPDPLFREVPKAVDAREIDEIVAGYAKVATHCAEGGFDGVELQCSHSSIVRGFLSPATNRRRDEYGGSLENRMRLLRAIILVVRDAIGPQRTLGVRLCGDELIEDGITIDEAVEVAGAIEALGAVDYLNTSIGVATMNLFMIEASMHVPPGYALFIPSAFRKRVSLPVIGVGRFKDPLQAEMALADGHCDLVGMVRAQIADPDLVNKARIGRSEDIRLCLSCNQECVGRMGLNRWLGCIENPRTGRENEPLAISGRAKRVLIVGAGPAGLQAAATAAERGHKVLVCERDHRPGGQVRLAASVPGRAEFGDLIRNQLHACRRANVEIRLGVEMDAARIADEKPDAIIVATGSAPALPYWAPTDPPAGAPKLADVRQVLDGSAQPQGRVIVVDELGFHQATSVAELLADRGCSVEVITSGMVVGQDLGVTLDMEGWQMRASQKRIVQSTDRLVLGLETGAAQLLHHPSGRSERREIDWIVLAVPNRPDDGLYFALKQAEFDVHRIGDCVAPRLAHAAVIEGHRIGVAL
jgi:mycofactocin system FadH/OYE family oxidoreductase 2